MNAPKHSRYGAEVIAIALFCFMLVLFLVACAPRYYPHARPKYPSSQPKFQP